MTESTDIISEEQFRLMDTCRRNGELYAFFLEIANRVVYDIVHHRLRVPVNGTNMYRHLQDYCQGGYIEKINTSEFLSDYQKKELLKYERNGEINLEKLDFTMYMKIYELLGGDTNTDLLKYLRLIRNNLCHVSLISLNQGMDQKCFKAKLNSMAYYFKSYGVDRTLVDTCKRYILAGFQSRNEN